MFPTCSVLYWHIGAHLWQWNKSLVGLCVHQVVLLCVMEINQEQDPVSETALLSI